MEIKQKILLLGGSGQLGKVLLNSKLFKNILAPSKKKLNLIKIEELKRFIYKKNITIIINCAAKARMNYCEKYPKEAIKVNIDGISNIVKVIQKKNIKLIQISSDAVYGFNSKNNKENQDLEPYNIYGWTKLCSEYLVKRLSNYIIIRTRLFIPRKKFNSYATDMVNSAININKMPKIVKKLIERNFKGVINIGQKNTNNYSRVLKINKNINKTNWKKIINSNGYLIAKNCTMNLEKMKKIIGKNID
tara:strand:- start:4244 stop:4984 length:741 start_codon:yes stop_codon:yes gene_type:complete